MGGTAAETDKKISAMVEQLIGGKRVSGDETVGGLSVTVTSASDDEGF